MKSVLSKSLYCTSIPNKIFYSKLSCLLKNINNKINFAIEYMIKNNLYMPVRHFNKKGNLGNYKLQPSQQLSYEPTKYSQCMCTATWHTINTVYYYLSPLAGLLSKDEQRALSSANSLVGSAESPNNHRHYTTSCLCGNIGTAVIRNQ